MMPCYPVELEMLDELQNALKTGRCKLQIYVFSARGIMTQAEWDSYIPGSGPVFQTPVIGVCREGEWVEIAQGAAARQVLKRVCIGIA